MAIHDTGCTDKIETVASEYINDTWYMASRFLYRRDGAYPVAQKRASQQKKNHSNNALREANELTFRELAEVTRIPEPTLYSWMCNGKLSATKDATVSHNGIWLIKADKKEIKQLLEYRDRPKQWIYRSRVEK